VVRLTLLCPDDPRDVQALYEVERGLGGEIYRYDLVCIAIDERHQHALGRQPSLHSAVSLSRQGKSKRRRTTQGASGVSGRTNLPVRCGEFGKTVLGATSNLSILSKISGITCAVGTYSGIKSQYSFKTFHLEVTTVLLTVTGVIFRGIPCNLGW